MHRAAEQTRGDLSRPTPCAPPRAPRPVRPHTARPGPRALPPQCVSRGKTASCACGRVPTIPAPPVCPARVQLEGGDLPRGDTSVPKAEDETEFLCVKTLALRAWRDRGHRVPDSSEFQNFRGKRYNRFAEATRAGRASVNPRVRRGVRCPWRRRLLLAATVAQSSGRGRRGICSSRMCVRATEGHGRSLHILFHVRTSEHVTLALGLCRDSRLPMVPAEGTGQASRRRRRGRCAARTRFSASLPRRMRSTHVPS